MKFYSKYIFLLLIFTISCGKSEKETDVDQQLEKDALVINEAIKLSKNQFNLEKMELAQVQKNHFQLL